MIAQAISFLVLVAVAAAASTPNRSDNLNIHETDRPLEGVDPNTLSCDPLGEIFLLLPHFTDCSKFYMCAHGQEVEKSCAPGGLAFDFVMQTCNWAWAVNCTLRIYDIEGSGFSEGEIGTFGEEIENGPVEILTAESSGTVRPVSALSDTQFNGVLNCNNADSAARQVAYKGDCQRYWKCNGPVAQSFYCSDGLFFNEATQQCDHEANVKCAVQIEDELQQGEFMVYK